MFTGRERGYIRLHILVYIGRIYGFYEGYLDVTPNHGESTGTENGQRNGNAGLIAVLSKFEDQWQEPLVLLYDWLSENGGGTFAMQRACRVYNPKASKQACKNLSPQALKTVHRQ